MKHGNKIFLILSFIFTNFAIADEKITTSPLINIQEIKPSFEVSLQGPWAVERTPLPN